MTTLDHVVRRQLRASTIRAVRDMAALLADPSDRPSDGPSDVVAVLFYGSNLRTGATEGVLDFYVLTAGPAERGIWPTVSYREFALHGETLRAKIATMRLATFAKAAAARTLDTTIWTRFVQPSALVWVRDDGASEAVVAAIGDATKSAARFAAALGPESGTADAYWRALFRQTYAAELRVERKGREGQILGFDPARYDTLLPLAWAADGIASTDVGGVLHPTLSASRRTALLRAWRHRRRVGKPLNIVRLVRAAFTFDGAARYGAWKVERHTGIPVPLTPWREKHPILAAPGVFWRVWRARERNGKAGMSAGTTNGSGDSLGGGSGDGFAALILAGSRGGVDPLTAYAGVSHKALILLEGRTLLARVAQALRDAGATRIAVSVSDDAVRAHAVELGLTVLTAAAGPSLSVREGIAALGTPLIVTTADHALLRPDWITRFLADAPADADVAALLARQDVIEAAAPGTRRTYLRFADGAWSGCNLFHFATPRSVAALDLWARVEADRKRPWRIVRRLGLGTLLRYLSGQLTLVAALAHLGRLAGLEAAAVATPFGLAAVDVDKPADLDLVRALTTR